ncbi:ASCH domain-containing protein [Actinotalea sp. K2]|uniref:ASCH domain-containing protein n=1 Tax=Actinotalea sp. K2 TaxID=2939438 RepID=UPI0020178B54|nr:ASCH domain-containing protein [Actinotalea sp. K2]MCL3860503.1 ASCH domain-containing protein [Actinotalea sp. K2]
MTPTDHHRPADEPVPGEDSGAGGADAPDGDEIMDFWELARGSAGLGRLAVVTGVGAQAGVAPPAWAFGDSPRLADELLGLVLDGVKTAASVSVAELEAAGEPVPSPGDLSIVLDGRGHPRALLRTTAVRVVPFDEVDDEHAEREGEDDRTLASWRHEHERYFRRVLAELGQEFEPTMPVVLERFECRFPAPRR